MRLKDELGNTCLIHVISRTRQQNRNEKDG